MSTPLKKVNDLGLRKADYGGAPTTLCQGCGHNSIASQIIQVAFELGIKPHEVIKLSGIGCSSKSPTYFLGHSHGFNALHGRMPSVATGAFLANHNLTPIGVSGDGDTASIGMGQFKHIVRRNVKVIYIVENNGVYGLTKGQFSATAEEGLNLKKLGTNPFPEIDLCLEAIAAGCGFVARSFAGDPKQVRELLKAAFHHNGTAFLDIISPCVTFNDEAHSPKSYKYGKEHELPLHEIDFIPYDLVPPAEEIMIDGYDPGTLKEVEMHDGSHIQLRKLEEDYNPENRTKAIERLITAEEKDEFITGLIYYNSKRPNLAETMDLVDTPLAQLNEAQLQPPPETLDNFMQSLM